MNPFEDRPDPLEGATIDRLVDGVLTDLERRDLLLRLENDPEGWRRVALAFLEDQAFRAALTPAASPGLDRAPLPGLAIQAHPRMGMSWVRRAPIAATLLASAFAGGFAAGLSRESPRVEVAQGNPLGPVEGPGAAPPGEIREVGSLDLVDGSAGETPPARFPILSGPGLDDQWLRNQPPSVPEYLRARWERQGYQVAEHRKLMSVELGDGRHVSIPVDEVELDFVGQQPL